MKVPDKYAKNSDACIMNGFSEQVQMVQVERARRYWDIWREVNPGFSELMEVLPHQFETKEAIEFVQKIERRTSNMIRIGIQRAECPS